MINTSEPLPKYSIRENNSLSGFLRGARQQKTEAKGNMTNPICNACNQKMGVNAARKAQVRNGVISFIFGSKKMRSMISLLLCQR